jgi:hypothetical protein
MKNPKRLFWLTTPISLVYFGASALSFYEFHRMVELLKYYGVSEEAQLRIDEVARWRHSLILAGVVFSIFGLVSAIVSYGVFRRKRWGIYLWYYLVGCFLIFHAFRAITSYPDGMSVLVERGLEILIALMVVVVTIVLVQMKKTPFSGIPPPPPEEWRDSHMADT